MNNTIELFVRITDHFVSPFSNWKNECTFDPVPGIVREKKLLYNLGIKVENDDEPLLITKISKRIKRNGKIVFVHNEFYDHEQCQLLGLKEDNWESDAPECNTGVPVHIPIHILKNADANYITTTTAPNGCIVKLVFWIGKRSLKEYGSIENLVTANVNKFYEKFKQEKR